ncbi:MAG: asparagine synthase B [Thermoanaerobaculia bacterium]
MCAIFGILDAPEGTLGLKQLALEQSRRQRHRGPDWRGVFADDRTVLVHERLAVVAPENGAQPLVNGNLVLAVNGEIYNHRELRERFPSFPFVSESDCEVLFPLYREYGVDLVSHLNGIFAFVLYDRESRRYLIGRDPVGVVPLYYARAASGALYVASEVKSLTGLDAFVEEFPPGSLLDGATGVITAREPREWREYGNIEGGKVGIHDIRRGLTSAVERQLMSDVEWGVLLSGGVDSSIIAKTAARAIRKIDPDARLRSFAIGLDESPDLEAARCVAEAIGSEHRQFTFSVEEGLDALSDVIYHIESYDVTTVRASVPMYLLARRIRSAGVRMVLSGEGSDEIFGGYLYFHRAPDARAFHEETVRKLELLHTYDCQRANKSMAAWGVEVRVPFLDREFIDLAMSMDPEKKMARDGKIEKHVLRSAFEGDLPPEILWRQKEQFSDGVGYRWIDALKNFAREEISDAALASAASRFPLNPPVTAEGYLYRCMFERHFPGDAFARLVPGGPSIACSTPAAIAWDSAFAASADPSGRAVAVHRRPTIDLLSTGPAGS